VKVHLYRNGFNPNYWIWSDHGEDMPHVDLNDNNGYMDASSSATDVAQGEQFMLMQEMVYDAMRKPFEAPKRIWKNLQMKILKDFTIYWWT